MAGGKGTRLQSISKDIPKPMFPIDGKPILEYQIETLKKSGITEVILIVGYLGNIIQKYFGDGQKFGVKIAYLIEDRPLGTAGALYYLKGNVTEDFVLLFGDLILDIDFNRFMKFHKNSGGLITLYCHPNAHPYDSDVVIADEENKVTKIALKNLERDFYYHNFVNAGIYCVSPRLLDKIKTAEKTDLEKELIAGQINEQNVYAYRSTEYVKDMGTPDRLKAVLTDIRNGIVAGRCLRHKQKAIFLDFWGPLNQYAEFLRKMEDFKLLDEMIQAMKEINQSLYLAIAVMNQPDTAKVSFTFQELEEASMRIEMELGKQGAYLDDILFYFRSPYKSCEEKIIKVKAHEESKSSKIHMLLRAAEKYNIDFSQSWYISDATTNLLTGIDAGMRTILVLTDEAEKNKKYRVAPEYKVTTFLDAIEHIKLIGAN
ncbi:MAG: NTP transferase domain-containing protein [Lachnospiraceae bacterium]|nr:NTP transferase domain-containing protein [Lachnospiraceae bacterium]